MANLACHLVYTFGNRLVPVLGDAHVVNSLDLGHENEGYKSD